MPHGFEGGVHVKQHRGSTADGSVKPLHPTPLARQLNTSDVRMLFVSEQGGTPGVLHHAERAPELRPDVVHHERCHAWPGAARHAGEPPCIARAEAGTHAAVSELMDECQNVHFT